MALLGEDEQVKADRALIDRLRRVPVLGLCAADGQLAVPEAGLSFFSPGERKKPAPLPLQSESLRLPERPLGIGWPRAKA